MSKTEAKDLQRWLENAGDRMVPAAQKHLNHFLTTTGIATGGGVPLVRVSEDVAHVRRLSELAETFSQEMSRRADLRPEDAFQVFAEYGGRLKAMLNNVPESEHDHWVEAFLKAGGQKPSRWLRTG